MQGSWSDPNHIKYAKWVLLKVWFPAPFPSWTLWAALQYFFLAIYWECTSI